MSRIQLLIVVGLLVYTPATLADTIYLKSGISITARKTEEKDGQIEYWVGDDQYSVPKSDVLKIEAGDAPVTASHSSTSMPANGAPAIIDLTRREPSTSQTVPQHEKLKLALPAGPKQNDSYWSGLRERIMVRDTIDDIRLAEIELRHDLRTTENAYFLAGVIEMERGNAAKASGYFEHAIAAKPDEVNLLQWHAGALASQGKYPDAAYELERATTLRPDSVELLRMLGAARYDADRVADAISAWKHAMEISPDLATERLLHKAQRELQVEERSSRKESRHFTLHYQGKETTPELQQQILASLETAYQDLSSQLGYEPGENIIVILYTQKEFIDITEAPSWAGALNDGKLRIPIGGITAMDPELERNLKHELTHSFVNSLGRGRCPVWLNEGLAQIMEPRSASMYAGQLSPLFLQRKAIPFSILEHSFTRFSNFQAEVAYAESLSAVEYLGSRYGMAEIVRMLQNIASGSETEQALQRSTGLDYSVLQDRIGDYLAHLQ
jgi:tetratricopeptide (TPR) repeat protein